MSKLHSKYPSYTIPILDAKRWVLTEAGWAMLTGSDRVSTQTASIQYLPAIPAQIACLACG